MTAVTGQALDDVMAGAVNLIVQNNMGRQPTLVPEASTKATPAVTAPADAVALDAATVKPTDPTLG